MKKAIRGFCAVALLAVSILGVSGTADAGACGCGGCIPVLTEYDPVCP